MIRKLEKKDIKTCVQIFRENFNKLGYSYDIKKYFLAQFKNNVCQLEFYVFEENKIIKGVSGLANCLFDEGVFGLCSCYVLPKFQKQGIGKELTKYGIKRIKDLGGKVILSTTAHTMYLKKFGFESIKSPDEYKEWKIMQLIVQ